MKPIKSNKILIKYLDNYRLCKLLFASLFCSFILNQRMEYRLSVGKELRLRRWYRTEGDENERKMYFLCLPEETYHHRKDHAQMRSILYFDMCRDDADAIISHFLLFPYA